ncbi:nucleotide sugar dehydrogenase [Actinopolyspora mortivallis]|uniref:Nucleotide sugar dehydrogenase n=1 Tax=Actinopolyspora mortivallis TaxID=33906 RepID=A0A2T0GYQ0_ACTMO|nr:nucleotide sugar dehydrogenase [Actinopolyspora mortivallis]PRW64242.1 nucleotide sugar dehydrogenase [Actinopolyspora mortivallis]
MRFFADTEQPTVAVVGLGYVGSCVAATLAERGARVLGVDSDAGRVAELNAGYVRFNEPGLSELMGRWLGGPRLSVTDDCRVFSEADVVLVTVGTPVRDDGTLDDEQLRHACHELGRHLRRGQLVIVKSTVPPGTTRNLLVPLLENGGLRCGEDFGLAFSPERLSEGSALHELGTFPIVVGGWCPDSSRAAQAFWRRGLGVEVRPVEPVEAAEIVKLVDNWWIDHNIALANEVGRFCAAFGVDSLGVISAANTIRRGNGPVNVLLPSVGVGGSCLTKDPWMVHRAARERGVQLRTVPTAREVNDSMPHHTCEMILEDLRGRGRAPGESAVAVLGLAYKNNTGDLRETPTLPVVERLRRCGVSVSVYDPLADPREVETMFGVPPCVSAYEAASGADCVAVLAWHRAMENLDFGELARSTAEGCLVLDGRAYFTGDVIDGIEKCGFRYRGVGR